jgi:hypothetical protein
MASPAELYPLRLKQSNLIKKKFNSTYFSKRTLFVYLNIYAVAAVFVSMHFYEWAGSITYLGAVLASTYILFHFGMWLDFSWKVLHSVSFGSLLGICVSLTYRNSVAYGFAFFIAFTIVNKCSNYERMSKVIGCIGILIAGLNPLVNPFADTHSFDFQWTTFYTVLSDVIMPFLFCGFTLLFPMPLLAYYEAQARMSALCVDMSTCVGAVTRAFCASEKVDLLRSCAEFLFHEIDGNLNTLTFLNNYIELEERYVSPLFLLWEKLTHGAKQPTKINFSSFVKQFLAFARPLMHELRTLDDALDKIQFNKTQSRFVFYMKDSLLDIAADSNELLNLVLEETNTFTLTSNYGTRGTSNISQSWWSLFFNSGVLSDPRIQSTQQRWAEYLSDHRRVKTGLEAGAGEEDALFGAQHNQHQHCSEDGDVEMGDVRQFDGSTEPRNAEHGSDAADGESSSFLARYAKVVERIERNATVLLDQFQAARCSTVWAHAPANSPGRKRSDSAGFIESARANYFENDNSYFAHFVEEDDQGNELRNENLNLSLLNLFPRGAFVHRLLKLKVGYCTEIMLYSWDVYWIRVDVIRTT